MSDVLFVFVCIPRSGLYKGWWPVVVSVCVSNFVYFYVFNGLKAVSYGKGAKPYAAKDLLLAFLAGMRICALENVLCSLVCPEVWS